MEVKESGSGFTVEQAYPHMEDEMHLFITVFNAEIPFAEEINKQTGMWSVVNKV